MNDSILLGLIGQGLDLSRTPAMHEAEGLPQGRATVYRRIDTLGSRASGQDLKTLLDAALYLGFNGLNITHPYKQAVLPLLDEVSEQATQLGAVNTVVIDATGHTTGHNTDVSGFGRGMEEGLPNAKLDSVVQVGRRRRKRSRYALVTHGVQKLQVADLDTSRAQALADVINNAVGREAVVGVDARGIEDVIAAADGVVNATPMGMPAHPTAFDVSCLTKDHWVGDVVYMPIETELLKAARALGCETLDGTRMAIHQAVDAFRLFTGLEPTSRMRETFLSL
nr:shikimate dehydrogenase [Corynebacterium glutamicum]